MFSRSSSARQTKFVRTFLSSAVAGFLLLTAPFVWGTEAKPSANILLYKNPARGYSIPVPPGADVAPSATPETTRIGSRKGYVVTIQTADAAPTTSVESMLAKFESENLGPGKRWNDKTATKPILIAKLSGLDTSYVGASTRSRVLVLRGDRTDHVLMFVATSERYADLTGEFEWMLAHFAPGPGEIKEKAPGVSTAARSPIPASAVRLDRRFADPAMGFSIAYPTDWIVEREGTHLVVFSGARGTGAFRATIGIENVSPPAATDPVSAFALTVSGFKSRLSRSVPDLRFEAETPLFRGEGSARVEGTQFLVRYTHGGEAFRKWMVVMRNPSAPVSHIWSYTAPDLLFEDYRVIAEAMLESWTPQVSR